MATCSASELLESGRCFQCLTKKELQIVIAQLLCAISEGGVPGVGLVGVVNPEGSVTAEPGTTYYNSANATFWVKVSGSGAVGWTQLI